MATKTTAAKKTIAAKKTATKKTTEKKTADTKAASKPASPKKIEAKKTTEKKAAPAKAPAKKAADKKSEKTIDKKASEAKAPAKKASEAKAPPKSAEAKAAPKSVEAKVTPKKAEAKAVEPKAPAKPAPAKKASEPKVAEKPSRKTIDKKTTPADAPRPAPSLAPTSGISQEDAEKILAEVQAGRRQPKGSLHAAVPLKLMNPRRPKLVSDLNPQELRQLVAAGADGTGEARTPEGWLDPVDESESLYGQIEIWDVVDAHGIPVYAVWMYLTDNGTVFRAGMLDIVGGISQGALECTEDGLEEALLEAKARVDKTLIKDSLLRFMG
ncbi:MAG: hypothetical protein QM820_41070 [Minicystis sp.]